MHLRTLVICLCLLIGSISGDEDLPFGVRGTVKCNGKGLSKVKISLKDHYSFFPDVSLSGGLTTEGGRFFIATMLKKVTWMDALNPYLEITSKCGADAERCQRFWLGKDAVEAAGDDHILELDIELRRIKFDKC